MNSTERLAVDLVPFAARLVAAVRDDGPADVAALLAAVPEGRHDALAVVLAAMVDPDRTPAQLLAWTDWDAAAPVTTVLPPPAHDDVDQLAVDHVRAGYRMQLTGATLHAAVHALTGIGLSIPAIAERTKTTTRQVERLRARATPPRPYATPTTRRRAA